MIPRRKFLRGLGAILAAPAIVKVGAIMPVRAWPSGLEWGPADVDLDVALADVILGELKVSRVRIAFGSGALPPGITVTPVPTLDAPPGFMPGWDGRLH